ncbi:MAG: hypothetical protein LUM44_14820 [Pyrinomonadaceae bacterium]|nr:hypothetical protein [Pyrinomonadaceae bacterium]
MKKSLFNLVITISVSLVSVIYAQAFTKDELKNITQNWRINSQSYQHQSMVNSNVDSINTSKFKTLYDPYNVLGFRNQYAKQQSLTIGVDIFSVSLSRWKENCYISPSVGPSTNDSISYSNESTLEPDTGFFVSFSAANGRSVGIAHYFDKGTSFQKGVSTPTVGFSGGYTFEVCKALSEYLKNK